MEEYMPMKKLGTLIVAPIDKIVELTPANCRMPVKSFSLTIPQTASKAAPGQFVMMWLAGVDEKPMGIASSDSEQGKLLFAVAKIGKATTALHKLKEGDLLGIRGPYGKGFNIRGKKIAIIGGGTGIAPSRFLVEKALEKGLDVTLFHGAMTANELAFYQYFKDLSETNQIFHYQPSTNDGTLGFSGFSTECWEASLKEKEDFDQVYTCGPELMMFKVWQLAKEHQMPLAACLGDRYFKCAIGLCGQCTVDPTGMRLCIDGPVFNQDQLEKMEDFGKFARDKFGRKISFE